MFQMQRPLMADFVPQFGMLTVRGVSPVTSLPE
jgi:hypothetical protein